MKLFSFNSVIRHCVITITITITIHHHKIFKMPDGHGSWGKHSTEWTSWRGIRTKISLRNANKEMKLQKKKRKYNGRRRSKSETIGDITTGKNIAFCFHLIEPYECQSTNFIIWEDKAGLSFDLWLWTEAGCYGLVHWMLFSLSRWYQMAVKE